MKKPVEAMLVAHLFPEMRAELLRVLHSLSDEQWQAPTACAGWSVKDIALHILADEVGYLSRHRDKDGITFVVDSWEELLEKINHQNEDWVRATRRMSRKLLLAFLEFTGEEMAEFLAQSNPYEGKESIAWAGKTDAGMWLQMARELTEYWMHHQHICEAVHIQSLKSRRYLHPVLSAFVFALPHTLRETAAPIDTTIRFSVTGEAADSWFIIREAENWQLYADTDIEATTSLTMPEDTAWRLFTKGIDSASAKSQSHITGNRELGEKLLNTVAIIA